MIRGTAEVDAPDGSLIGLHEGMALGYDRLMDGTPIMVSSVPVSPDSSQTHMAALGLDFKVIGTWLTSGYAEWLAPRP